MTHSHAAGCSTDASTAQFKEFFSQANSGRITKRRLQRFLRGSFLMENEHAVVEIMEEDIVFPDEVFHTFTPDYLSSLSRSLPDLKTLKRLKKNGFALVPGPEEERTFVAARAMFPRISTVLGEEGVDISRCVDTVKSGWLAMRKEVIPDSTFCTRDKVMQYVTNIDRIPNAVELAWFISMMRCGQGHCSYPLMGAWTSSDQKGVPIVVSGCNHITDNEAQRSPCEAAVKLNLSIASSAVGVTLVRQL